jgi:hypothetical protein
MRKKLLVLALVILTVIAVVWGWLYRGWSEEQQALAALNVPPVCVTYSSIGSPWLRQHSGPLGFVLERATEISLFARADITDISPLARLTRLQDGLSLHGTKVTDLSPLTHLTNLEELDLSGTPVTDLSPLSGLTKIRSLDLRGTKVHDFSPLNHFTRLEDLDVTGTPITDLWLLDKLTSLRQLVVSKENITEAQAKEFHRAMPNCWVRRE